MHDAAVAQLDRVLGYEPRGRGFDSCQPHQKLESPQRKLWAFSISGRQNTSVFGWLQALFL
jgi:hypothetical protein